MLTEADIALVAREVKARTGATITPELAGPVEIKLTPLARRESFMSVSELVTAARGRPDGALWNLIADALAQSDTRFFRDRDLFKRLHKEIIPAAAERRGAASIRIWSAGCSTGQEPYSIAMLLEDMRAEGFAHPFDIIATDHSGRLLEKARAGLYTQFEVQRGLPIRKLITHFEKAGDLWRICDRMRAAVRFEHHNLLKHPGGLGEFDIIMFAHVLPGLDPNIRAETLTRVSEVLAPGGVILLGAGETLPSGCAGFQIEDGVASRASGAQAAA